MRITSRYHTGKCVANRNDALFCIVAQVFTAETCSLLDCIVLRCAVNCSRVMQLKYRLGIRIVKSLRTLKSSAKAMNANSMRCPPPAIAPGKTLIDPVDQRLLYSADHPLGLAIGVADFQDDITQSEDAALVSAVMATLEQEHLSSRMINFDPDEFTVIEVTTTDDVVDAEDMSSLAAFYNDVGDDDKVSLREAIMVANQDSTVDIVYLPDGEYRLVLDSTTNSVAGSGDLDIQSSYSIHGESEGGTVVIQTVDGRRVFQVHEDSVKFSDLTISGGDEGSNGHGAGVSIDRGVSPTEFENVTITNNTGAELGGAIYAQSLVILNNVTLSNNYASQGGGLFVTEHGEAEIRDSDIINNRSNDDGGGIYNLGTVRIYDSVISSNDVNSSNGTTFLASSNGSAEGGGIFNAGNLFMSDSSLIDNTSGIKGGGLSNSNFEDGNNVFSGFAELDGVTVWGNTASGSAALGGGGGGIYNSAAAEFELNNSTVALNNSQVSGAGITSYGVGFISDSLIMENFVNTDSGVGGIAIFRTDGNEVTIRNSVVANNSAGGVSSDIRSNVNSTKSGGFNFIDDSINFVGADLDTDIRGDDPGISGLSLVDNRANFTVSADSPTLHTGSTFGVAELEGSAPNIGGYTLSADTGKVFWSSDTGRIYRSDDQFSYSQEIITGLTPVIDLEADAGERRVYWLNQDTDTIMSARFDGTDISEEQEVLANASEFEFDRENQRFYVLGESGGTYQIKQYFKSDTLTNEAQEQSGEEVYSSSNRITALELDRTNDLLYWAEETLPGFAEIASIETRPSDSEAQEPPVQIVIGESQLLDEPFAIIALGSTGQLFLTQTEQQALLRYETANSAITDSFDVDPVFPQSLTHDTINDLLLYTGRDLGTVSYTTTGFNESDSFSTLPERASHLAFAEIETLANGTFTLDVTEGGPATIDNDVLGVLVPDTDDADVVFTVVDISAGEIQVGGSMQSSFTLAELKNSEGIVQFSHSDDEPSVPAYIELSVADGETTVLLDRINITVEPVNDNAPVAQDHLATGKHFETITTVDGSDTSLLAGVTDADEDQSADGFTVQVVTEPTGGNLEVDDTTGTFSYTPPNESVGEDYRDSFTYQVLDDDGVNVSNTATVTLEIEALPAPSINEDIASMLTDEVAAATELDPFSITLDRLLFSSEETNAQPFTWQVSVAESGAGLPDWLSFDADNLILSGTPQDQDTGELALQVVVTDNNDLTSEPVSFVIDVQDIDQPPTQSGLVPTLMVEEGGLVALDNDVLDVMDPDTADADVKFRVTELSGGEIKVGDNVQTGFTLEQLKDPQRLVQFSHSSDEPSVPAYIDLIVADDQTTIVIDRINVTVEPVNDNAPVAQDHLATGKHFETITTVDDSETSLLAGVTDADEDQSTDGFTVQVVTRPMGGTLVVNADDGTFSYTPPDDSVGENYSDSFTYQVLDDDGVNVSNTATVTLEIEALPAPNINEDIASMLTDEVAAATELDPFSITLDRLLFSSEETNAQPFTWQVSVAESGAGLPDWLSFDADNLILSGTPQDQDTGELALQVVVTDNNDLTSEPVSFVIDVQDIDQPPTQSGLVPTLMVEEGGLVALDNDVLDVMDPDTADADVKFRVTELSGGEIKVGDSVQTGFTLEQLKDPQRLVQFSHSSDEPSVPAYIDLIVADDQTTIVIDRINVTVEPVNDNAPVAKDHLATGKHFETITTVDDSETSLLAGVTDADEDQSADGFTVQVVTEPTGGNLEVDDTTGTFSYTPPNESVGEDYRDSFTYQVLDDDGVNVSNTATVTLEIEALPAPSINEDIASMLTDEAVTATELELFTLRLDSELFSSEETNAYPFSWEVREPEPGVGLPQWLRFNGDAEDEAGYLILSGTPGDTDAGELSLEVLVTDNNNLISAPVSFTIDVQNIDQRPVVSGSVPADLAVDEGGSLALDNEMFGVSDADTDDTRVIFTVEEISGGQIQLQEISDDGSQSQYSATERFTLDELNEGRVQFQHSDEEPSVDAYFDLTVDDELTDYEPAGEEQAGIVIERIGIEVDAVNDNPPVAKNHVISGTYFETITTLADEQRGTSLLSGATDADEGQLTESYTVELLDNELIGDLNVNPITGTFTYTPSDELVGEDYIGSFTYRILDETGVEGRGSESDIATVTVNIEALPAPSINDELASILREETIIATEAQAFSLTLDELLFSSEQMNAQPFSWEVREQSPGVGLPAWLSFNNEVDDDDYLTLSGEPGDADTGEILLEVLVTDNNNLTSNPIRFTIEVENIDQPPEVRGTLPSGLQVTEGGTLTLDNDALAVLDVLDPDSADTEVVFTVEQVSGGEIRVGGERSDTFTLADLDDSGLVQFEHLGDEPSLGASIELTVASEQTSDEPTIVGIIDIRVNPVNDNPPFAPDHTISGKHLETITTLEDGQTSLLLGVTDADENQSTEGYTVQVVDPPSEGTLVVDPDTGTFTYTPPEESVGEDYDGLFTYQVLDNTGIEGVSDESNVATVTLAIEALQGPGIDADIASMLTEENLVATEVQTPEFSKTFNRALFTGNEDSDATSFTWEVRLAGPDIESGLPDWLLFDAETLILNGTPADADTNDPELALEVVVRDNHGLQSEPVSFTINVVGVNQAPEFTDINLSPVPENSPGAEVGTLQASDPDSGDTLRYTVDDERFEIVGETLKLKNSESLDFEQESTIRFAIDVIDSSGANASETIDVLATDENDAPVVDNALGEQQLDANSVLVLSADTFTDQDNDVLSYSVTSADGEPIPDFLVYDPNTKELSLGSAPDETVTVQLILTADDGQGGVAQMVFFVTAEAEPELVAATLTTDTSSDIEFVRIAAGSKLQQTDDEVDSELGDEFSESAQGLVSQDSLETVALLTAESINRLFGMSLFEVSADDTNNFEAQVLSNNTISDFLESQRTDESLQSSSLLGINVFDESVNLAALFGAAMDRDTDMFSSLSSDFEKRSEEIENQLSAARIALGSSLTVTSGLSVGYFLYLLRGGAIMSSMLTSLPAWRFVDPLPILGNLQDSLDADNESLQSMVTKE